jgi:hypothetical protein
VKFFFIIGEHTSEAIFFAIVEELVHAADCVEVIVMMKKNEFVFVVLNV